MTATLQTFLPALAGVAAIFTIVYGMLMYRAQAMKRLAAKWGFT